MKTKRTTALDRLKQKAKSLEAEWAFAKLEYEFLKIQYEDMEDEAKVLGATDEQLEQIRNH